MIKQGDEVKVRLFTGEVIEATYIEPSSAPKCHRVDAGAHNPDTEWASEYLLAVADPRNRLTCRFVGNPAVSVEV